MKRPLALLLVLVATLVTYTIQEIRLFHVRQELSQLGSQTPDQSANKNRVSRVVATESQDPWGHRGTRKLDPKSPTPVLIQQGLRISIPNLYGSFITGLNLDSDENDYFESLLLGRLVIQHQFGANYSKASAPCRPDTVEDFRIQITHNDLKIKRFLNHPEDYADFTKYENQLPERRGFDEIRAFISPLSPETEKRLIDLLYHCRIKTEGKT